MRKFSKILTLILVVMALITAFTVVALADSDTGLQPIKGASVDFEDRADEQNYSNSASKDGKWTTYEADNGNIYVSAEAEDVAGTNTQENIDPSTGRATSTNIQNYPTVAFDFDIRSTTGSFSSTSIRYDIYGGGGNWRISQGTSTYLSETHELNKVNEWQHVTFIVRHEGAGLFRVSIYVDGVLSTYTFTKSYAASDPVNNPNEAVFSATNATNKDTYGIYNWNNLLNEDGSYKYNNIGIGYFSIYACAAGRDIHFDNFEFNFFPESYTNDDVASYVYNSEYEMPYGYTKATLTDNESGTVTYYDDFDKAFAAANKDNTLTLMADLTEAYNVNKAINVNKNGFAFEYYSKTGYVPTIDGELYTFELANQLVNVVWDPDCSDETCTCYEHGIAHELTDTAIVPLGYTPEYSKEIFINKEGVVAEFLGWSYTKGGEVDEITEITEQQAALGTLYLYPVYNITKYDIGLTDADGNHSFYMADEFETVVTNAIANTGIETIVLYSDIEYYKSFALTAKADLKIDLNGHTLTRINLYGAVKNYDAASGTYIDGTATTSKSFVFTASNVTGINLTITSSKEGAIFRSASINGTAWYDANGKLEKYEATSVAGGSFISNTCSGGTFNLENFELYALNIQYGSHNGSPTQNINITNLKFYRTAGSETTGGWGYDGLYLAGTVNLTAKNSLFYLPASSVLTSNVRIIRMQGAAKCSIVFDNCDIISNNSSVSLYLESANHSLSYTNCRLYNYYHESATNLGTFGNDVIIGNTANLYGRGNVADGHIMLDKTQTITYSLPTNSRVTIDANTKLPVFDFAFTNKDISFVKQTVLYTDYFTKVTWLDENGELIEVSDELKNELATAPAVKVPVGDGYRAFTNPYWLDENGNKASLTLGTLDAYTMKMSTELPEEPVYVAYMTSAMFNMSYYGHFAYNLYAPVVEGVTIVEIGDYAPKTVIINGQEYWTANAGWLDPKAAIKDTTKYIVYNIDGQEFTATFKLSALVYASLLLAEPETVEVEKNATLAMMTYVEEVYKYVAGGAFAENSTDKAKFDEFFNTFNSGARYAAITDYPESEVHEINEEFAKIGGVSFSFGIDTTNRMTILVTLSKENVDKGYTLSMSSPCTFSGSKTNDDGSVTYYTNNVKVYSTIMATEYIVSINDAEGTLATTSYSLATYCSSVDSDLADALYTFGKALIEARNYLGKL